MGLPQIELNTRASGLRFWMIAQYIIFVVLCLTIYFFLPPRNEFGDNNTGKAINLIEGRGFADPSVLKVKGEVFEYSLLHFWVVKDLQFATVKPNQPTAFWEPLYIIWLALCFKLFGYFSPMVTFVQILVMGLVIPLTVYTGKQAFNDLKVGIAAGGFLLFHPYLHRFPLTYPTENLFIPLLIAGCALYYWCKSSPSSYRIALFSAVLLAMSLTRMTGIFIGLFILSAYYLVTPAARKFLLVTVAIFVVGWGAWMYRNYNLLGEPLLLPTKVGYNLWAANNRYYINQYFMKRNPSFKYPIPYTIPEENKAFLQEHYSLSDKELENLRRYDYPAQVANENEIVINETLKRSFNTFLWDHPGIFLSYSLRRVVTGFTENLTFNRPGAFEKLSSVYHALFFVFGIAGFVLLFIHYKQHGFLLLLFLMLLASLATGPCGFRFRIPLDPILALCAGFAGYRLFSLLQRRILQK
ncbi:MAG: hypothetical protein NTW14_09300 [bacterium]|nr:hypothetical protein [bacterium]